MLKLLLKIFYTSPKYFLIALVFFNMKIFFLICIIKFFLSIEKVKSPVWYTPVCHPVPPSGIKHWLLQQLGEPLKTAFSCQPWWGISSARSQPLPRWFLPKGKSTTVISDWKSQARKGYSILRTSSGIRSVVHQDYSSSTPSNSGFPPSLPSLWGDKADLYIDCGADPHSTAQKPPTWYLHLQVCSPLKEGHCQLDYTY